MTKKIDIKCIDELNQDEIVWLLVHRFSVDNIIWENGKVYKYYYA